MNTATLTTDVRGAGAILELPPPREFRVQRIAISLVDPYWPRQPPSTVPSEVVDLEAYSGPDLDIIERFLDRHLKRAWNLPEGGRTRSARFKDGSAIQAAYEKLTSDLGAFRAQSQAIAQRLFEVTPEPRPPIEASKGVLLILWFEKVDEERPFLGLLKLDPRARDNVFLERKTVDEFLLRIAVQHLDFALPEPGDRVLKWAIAPHPSEERYQVKLRDEQGDRDPAFYFVDFLQCKDFEAERDQAATALTELQEMLKDLGRPEAPKKGVPKVLATATAARKPVTSDMIIQWALRRGLIQQKEVADLRKRLDTSKAAGMAVSPSAFANLGMQYTLKGGGGITISGRLVDVLSLVDITRDGADYVFNITTPDYQVDVQS